jgi:hypothetical protein
MMDRALALEPSSAGLAVTDSRDSHLTLILRPHIEQRNGCRFHLDRFDACLNGELILTSRQPWYDRARELLRRGYPGDTLLTLRHAGEDYDRFMPRCRSSAAKLASPSALARTSSSTGRSPFAIVTSAGPARI